MNAHTQSNTDHAKPLAAKRALPTPPIASAMSIVSITLLALITLTGLLGCASSQTALNNPLPIDTAAYNPVFQAAMDTLQDQGFRLDRRDYRFGVITTYPKVSPTIFEPWYDDNTTANQAIASTVNYQRRRVSIRLLPEQAPAKQAPITDIASNSALPLPAGYLLDAQVFIEQVETPRRFLTGSTDQGRIFRNLHTAPANLKVRGISDNYWRVIGRDTGMEQKLIASILQKSNHAEQTQPPDSHTTPH